MTTDPRLFRKMAEHLDDRPLTTVSRRMLDRLVAGEVSRESSGMALEDQVAWDDEIRGAGTCDGCGEDTSLGEELCATCRDVTDGR